MDSYESVRVQDEMNPKLLDVIENTARAMFGHLIRKEAAKYDRSGSIIRASGRDSGTLAVIAVRSQERDNYVRHTR